MDEPVIDEIACIEVSAMRPGDLAFLVRAVDIQMREHVAPAYDEITPDVRSYATLVGLDRPPQAVISILDDIEYPGALGFHDVKAGIPFGRCKVRKDVNDGTTLSHETIELWGDPNTDLWLPLPDGRRIARELCDPCQDDEYTIDVTIGSETRAIAVSDFVLPAYFVPGAPPPYTYRDTIDEVFGTSRNGGGWRLVRDASGKVTSEAGPIGSATPAPAAAMAARLRDPGSRTYRRLTGGATK